MRYPKAHADSSGSVPFALFGKKSVRTVMSAAVAAVIGVAPALVYSAPAMAAPGDLTFSVVNPTAAEGGTFTINYSYTGTGASYTLVGAPVGPGGAVQGVGKDYTVVDSTVLTSLGDGSGTPKTGTITVTALTDKAYEGDESFTITATEDGGGGDTEETPLTITDVSTPTFSLTSTASATAVTELASPTTTTANVVATLTNGWTAEKDFVVSLNTLDGTAMSTTDYAALLNEPLTIEKDTVTDSHLVTIKGDGLKDSALVEQFSVIGTGPSGGAPVPVTIRIQDNATDVLPPKLTLVAPGANAEEGSNATFTVHADHGSDLPVTVNWQTLDPTPTSGHGTATAGTDFTYPASAGSRLVTFDAGDTDKTFNVATLEDSSFEGPEDFKIGLTTPSSNAELNATNTTAQGTIVDKGTQAVTITPIKVDEGSSGTKWATFTATLKQASTKEVKVDWETADNTAMAALDYVKASGTLTFPANTLSQTFTVGVLGDTIDEGESEAFKIKSWSTDLGINAPVATDITITDDDAAPSFTFNNLSVKEGKTPGAVLVPITLSNASANPIDFDIADVLDGSGDPSFSAGDVGSGDYTLLTDAVTIQAGQTEGYVVVLVNGDEIFEKTETVNLKATPANASLPSLAVTSVAAKPATLTLENDDKAVDFEINNVIGEEGGTVNVTGTVTGVSDDKTTVTVIFTGQAADRMRAADANDFVNPGAKQIDIIRGTVPGTVLDVAKVQLVTDTVKEPAEAIVASGYGSNNIGTVTPGVITVAAQDGSTTPEEPGGEEPGGEEPGEAPKPTINAPKSITGAGPVSITGKVAANATVELWGAPVSGGELKWIANSKAGATGNYSFSRSISQGMRFATQSQEVTSAEVEVWVNQWASLTASSPSRGRVSVVVKTSPNASGRKVVVQRWTGPNTWTNILVSRANVNGAYTATTTAPRGTIALRAWVEGDADLGINGPGWSSIVRPVIR